MMLRRTFERVGILLACIYVAWLILIDPTYLALDDDEPILIGALAVSIATVLLGAACAVYSTWAG